MTPDLGYDSMLEARAPARVAAIRRQSTLGSLIGCYVALLPYQVQVTPQLRLAPADAFLLLIVLLAPGQLKLRKPAWTIWHLALLLVFALGSLVSVTYTGTLDRYELLNKDLGLLFLFLSYMAITSAATDWLQVRRVLRIFAISVVLQNLVAVGAYLASYFFHIDTPFTSYGGARLAGMLVDPNAYGGLLVLALAVCEGGSWGPAPLFAGAGLLFCRVTLCLGLLFTFSRSAWVSLGLVLLVLCALRRRVVVRFAIAGLAAIPLLFLALGPRFLAVFEDMAGRPKQVEGRFELMHDAFAAFSAHPFLGGGLGSFRLSEGTVMHNTALWFLSDFGMLGLAVLLLFLGWFFFKAWYALRFAPAEERPVMLALLLGHTAMLGLAMGIEGFYQRHWWMIMALIASSYPLARQSRAELLRSRAEDVYPTT